MSRHGSVSMSVLADIKRYQAEIAKIPGYTDREAAKAATALEKRMNAANEKAAKEAEKAARRAAQSWTVAIGTMAGQLAARAVETLIQSMKETVKSVVDLRNNMVTLSDNTGIALDTMGALAVAAQREGEAFETLAGAVGRTGDMMLKADQGSARALRVFERLGVEVRDADGAFKDVNDALPDLVERIQGIENHTERAALATQLWGSEAETLLRSLDGRPLADWQRAARAAGVTVSEESAKAVRSWTNEYGMLKSVLLGITNDVIESYGSGGSAFGAMRDFTIGIFAAWEMAKDLGRVIKQIAIGWTDFGRGLLSGDFSDKMVAEAFAGFAAEASRLDNSFDRATRKAKEFVGIQEQLQRRRTTVGPAAADPDLAASQAAAAEADSIADLQRAYEQLMQIQGKQQLAQLEGQAKIREERDREIAQIAALGIEAEQLHLAERLIEQVRLDAHHRQIDLIAERIDAAEAEGQRLAEIARETARQVDSAWTDASSTALNGLRTIADHAAGSLRSGSDQARSAAVAWFNAAKVLGLADVAIKTQQAIMAALATGGPMAPALAVSAGIQGATAAATIAAQQPRFHSGMRAGLQGDEVPAVVTRRETIIDAQTTRESGGAEGIRRMLRGGRRDETPVLIADFADRSVIVPLSREVDRASRRRSASPLGLRQDGGI